MQPKSHLGAVEIGSRARAADSKLINPRVDDADEKVFMKAETHRLVYSSNAVDFIAQAGCFVA